MFRFFVKSVGKRWLSLGFVIACSATPLHAAVIWNEGISGDLSNDQANPTSFTLSPGINSIIGSVVNPADRRDWVMLTVPDGYLLSSVILASYISTDTIGFTGVQAGTAFVGSPDSAGSYLGYTHFGTGPGNVGADILPEMGIAAGATGFTPPLASGSYVFLIQQTGGAVTNYQFDYVVTPVPEPGLPLLLGGGLLLLAGSRRVRTGAS